MSFPVSTNAKKYRGENCMVERTQSSILSFVMGIFDWPITKKNLTKLWTVPK